MKKLPTLIEATQAIATKETSATELTQANLSAIEQGDTDIHAYLEVTAEHALAAAAAIDQQADTTGDLAGVPIAVKDIICTTAGHTTAASKILETFRAPYNATAVAKLQDAGAHVIGKTNLDEFAMGVSTEYSAFGPTKNPWDTSRIPGGSSGGSAAAVAAGTAIAALGTDTGGSIRNPASLCGVVGVKPTYGRVSRFGSIAYGSSLDQIGPITQTVADAALLLRTMAGPDERDATSAAESVPDYVAACTAATQADTPLTEKKIGIPAEFFGDGVDPEVSKVVKEAIAHLEKLGATPVEISLPLTGAGIAVYYLIAKAEASANLARYDGLRFAPPAQTDAEVADLLEHYLTTRGHGFGPEVKRAILMGTYTLSAGYADAWYKQASRVRTLIKQEFQSAFKEVDVIAGPVSPEVAWPLGEKADDPLAMYLADALTVTISVAGIPAMSVPCGFVNPSSSQAKLPVGLQLITPHFQEERLFATAAAYEHTTNWHKDKP